MGSPASGELWGTRSLDERESRGTRRGEPRIADPARTLTGRIWAVVGATGTGKTALSLDLAEYLSARGRPTEIVNADAMQFYRGMDIGTAKVPIAERRGIRHHLFDALHPTEEATVAWYQPAARHIISGLTASGKDVVLVGGSGLYVSSVLFDFHFPPRDEELRSQLERELETEGVDSLLAQLTELAPEVAQTIDPRNPRRVVRALEVAKLGDTAHGVLPEAPQLWHEDTRIIGVHSDRAELVARLDQRVRQIWEDGLIEEVRQLQPQGLADGKTASRAIGYSQALSQLTGSLTESEAIAETQALTRRYARRQVSWFKRYQQIEWITGPDLSQVAGLDNL